jgi:oxygen-independent coproporphyrinogen III oxidase
MAGIYIHIPFCRKACHYCNFHFSTSLRSKNEFTRALLKEIELQHSFFADTSIDTVYFGGGTPSLLSDEELDNILNALHKSFRINSNAEQTLETNPDDIFPEKLDNWKKAGINRLSIGVQSFFNEDLVWMNRAHNSEQATRSILLSQDKGIENLTIDLIYGTPTLSDKNWEENVSRAIDLHIPHLSCYALTVEPKTALHEMIRKNKFPSIDHEDQSRQFLLLMDWMEAEGFEHYEISNFAKPGKRSRHNSSYWKGSPYLGLGPSAHSYNGTARKWNVSNNALYIQSIEKGMIPFEEEILTPVQRLNEYLMISARTIEGIDLTRLRQMYNEKVVSDLRQNAERWINQGLLIEKEGHYRLTKQGKLFADGIAADLFFDELPASASNDPILSSGSIQPTKAMRS